MFTNQATSQIHDLPYRNTCPGCGSALRHLRDSSGDERLDTSAWCLQCGGTNERLPFVGWPTGMTPSWDQRVALQIMSHVYAWHPVVLNVDDKRDKRLLVECDRGPDMHSLFWLYPDGRYSDA